MAITVTAPDAFYDQESWSFGLTVNQENGEDPVDLTGSRLFVRFVDLLGTVVGVCDSAAANNSLSVTNPQEGMCEFFVSNTNRSWSVTKPHGPYSIYTRAQVTGDLYRFAPNSEEAEGLCTITLDVLPSTGLPLA